MFRIITSIMFVFQVCFLAPAKAEESAQHSVGQSEGLILSAARALHLRSKYISYQELRFDRPRLFTSIKKLDDVGIDGGRGGDTRFMIGLEWRSNFLQ